MDFKKAWNRTNEYANQANKVIKPMANGFVKVSDKSSQFVNKGAKKTVEELNSFSSGAVTVKCPVCRSKDVVFLQNERKGFSVGKAIGGAVLTGGVGALAGFAGKKGKNQYHCNNCGRNFRSKK